jgi:hypothetical protein
MKSSLIACPVAKKTGGNLILLAHFLSQGATYGNGKPAADNGIGAKVAFGKIADMHGAAASVAKARFLSHQFRKGAFKVAAFGDAVAVAAVGTGDIIAVIKEADYRSAYRFLAYAQVHRAAEFVFLEEAKGRFFKKPYLLHDTVNIQQFFLAVVLVFQKCLLKLRMTPFSMGKIVKNKFLT